MLEPVLKIRQFIAEAFLQIWPYVVVTVPLAVAVQMSGASRYIKRAFEARPLTAVALATVLGAFSPFCSRGVIPVIASLLISGLLTQGMNPAAARAFLIAGPVTTLPAMAAVWPLVARRVFILYVSFCMVGAVLMGYFYQVAAKWL